MYKLVNKTDTTCINQSIRQIFVFMSFNMCSSLPPRMKDTSKKNNIFSQFRKNDRDKQKLIETVVKQLRSLVNGMSLHSQTHTHHTHTHTHMHPHTSKYTEGHSVLNKGLSHCKQWFRSFLFDTWKQQCSALFRPATLGSRGSQRCWHCIVSLHSSSVTTCLLSFELLRV